MPEQFLDSSPDQEFSQLHRLRHSRRKKSHSTGWVQYGYDISPLFLLVFALLVLFAPFYLSDATLPLLRWFGEHDGNWVLGVPLTAVALVACGRRLRWLINHYPDNWSSHCPNCQGKQLKRTPRHLSDRLFGRLGIPVRRYICADCRWHGRLIDETRLRE